MSARELKGEVFNWDVMMGCCRHRDPIIRDLCMLTDCLYLFFFALALSQSVQEVSI